VKENVDEGIELEIREHSDADLFPERWPHCKSSHIKRLSYRIRKIQGLGTPRICRRIHYERVYFQCTKCKEIFIIEHPLIPIGTHFMPGVIEHVITRVLKKQDLKELHLVKVSKSTVQRWVNEHGNRNYLPIDLSEETPTPNFSGFLSLDGISIY